MENLEHLWGDNNIFSQSNKRKKIVTIKVIDICFVILVF